MFLGCSRTSANLSCEFPSIDPLLLLLSLTKYFRGTVLLPLAITVRVFVAFLA